MTEHISCGCKCKFNSAICNSNQKWNYRTCQCKCKNYRICDKSKYLKSTSVTECDEIITVIDIVSTKKTIATNVTSTDSIDCHSKDISVFCTQFY